MVYTCIYPQLWKVLIQTPLASGDVTKLTFFDSNEIGPRIHNATFRRDGHVEHLGEIFDVRTDAI
jgi:hypothetical protein